MIKDHRRWNLSELKRVGFRGQWDGQGFIQHMALGSRRGHWGRGTDIMADCHSVYKSLSPFPMEGRYVQTLMTSDRGIWSFNKWSVTYVNFRQMFCYSFPGTPCSLLSQFQNDTALNRNCPMSLGIQNENTLKQYHSHRLQTRGTDYRQVKRQCAEPHKLMWAPMLLQHNLACPNWYGDHVLILDSQINRRGKWRWLWSYEAEIRIHMPEKSLEAEWQEKLWQGLAFKRHFMPWVSGTGCTWLCLGCHRKH